VLSEESVDAVENKVKENIGVQGVEEKWNDKKLLVERSVLRPHSLSV
jgi:hypothetical protein